MLHIGRRPKASLQTILEENSDSESQGSTEIIDETTTTQPPFPPFCGGKIFNISVDSPSWNGETKEECTARINRNVNYVQCRANEATVVMVEAQLDSQGRPRQVHYNLNDEFVRVDGHDIYKTPSTNLAVAANELTWLPQTPVVAKVPAMLKAAHC